MGKQLKEDMSSLTPIVIEYPLLTEMTFQSFVSGSSNQLAYDVCLEFAKNHAQKYNPLVIYGPAGCGKSHLQNAIGNYLIENGIFKRDETYNVSAERFVTTLSRAIQDNNVQEFRNYYRSKKIILMDMINFMTGKPKPQKELYYLFNFFYDNMRPMVFTCDTHPRDLEDFDQFLKSRFERGGIAEIAPPEMETRIRVINIMVKQEHIDLPDEAIRFIQSNITGSVRALQGFIVRLDAYVRLHNTSVTLSLVDKLISEHKMAYGDA